MDRQIQAKKKTPDEKLDEEFREILCIIKDYIVNVNSNHKLNVYRTWLEKLNSDCSNKAVRNSYLLELARQVRGNIVSAPFDKQPSKGELKSFNEYQFSHGSDVPINIEPENDTEQNRQYLTYLSQSYPEIKKLLPYLSHLSGPLGDADRLNEPIKLSKEKELRSSCINIHDDSSWCDVSDCSSSSITLGPSGSGDGERKKVEHKAEPEKENNEPKFTNVLVTDWEKTVESLQERLNEIMVQNNDLKHIVNALTVRMQEETASKAQCESSMKKLLEEMEILKKDKEEIVTHLERTFKSKLIEAEKSFRRTLEETRNNFEKQMTKFKTEYNDRIKEKDLEISRLTQTVNEQCANISEEITALRQRMDSIPDVCHSAEKITVLQKCVSKMDKLFHKSEKNYTKQIDKLKQEIDLKDKVMAIQLKAQKAEIIARTSAEKQMQFDTLANDLEVKYIRMMEYHEAENMKSRKEEEGKIEYLVELLEKHDIPVCLN